MSSPIVGSDSVVTLLSLLAVLVFVAFPESDRIALFVKFTGWSILALLTNPPRSRS